MAGRERAQEDETTGFPLHAHRYCFDTTQPYHPHHAVVHRFIQTIQLNTRGVVLQPASLKTPATPRVLINDPFSAQHTLSLAPTSPLTLQQRAKLDLEPLMCTHAVLRAFSST